jgi:hypothetical protein
VGTEVGTEVGEAKAARAGRASGERKGSLTILTILFRDDSVRLTETLSSTLVSRREAAKRS